MPNLKLNDSNAGQCWNPFLLLRFLPAQEVFFCRLKILYLRSISFRFYSLSARALTSLSVASTTISTAIVFLFMTLLPKANRSAFWCRLCLLNDCHFMRQKQCFYFYYFTFRARSDYLSVSSSEESRSSQQGCCAPCRAAPAGQPFRFRVVTTLLRCLQCGLLSIFIHLRLTLNLLSGI